MSVWDQYPNLSGDDLRVLVALTGEALLDSEEGSAQFPPNFLGISPKAASLQLLPLLQEENPGITQERVQSLLEDETLSIEVCHYVLDEVRKYPELAQWIADAYEERKKAMFVPELLLLAGAVVILAIKIKEIRWSDKEKRISFYESSEAVKQFVSGLTGKITGED